MRIQHLRSICIRIQKDTEPGSTADPDPQQNIRRQILKRILNKSINFSNNNTNLRDRYITVVIPKSAQPIGQSCYREIKTSTGTHLLHLQSIFLKVCELKMVNKKEKLVTASKRCHKPPPSADLSASDPPKRGRGMHRIYREDVGPVGHLVLLPVLDFSEKLGTRAAVDSGCRYSKPVS
jgi:hypothetical protein